MLQLNFDMYQTVAIAVVALFLGDVLKRVFPVLERFCIPSPVAGGLVFAIFTCVLYVFRIAEISFNDTLREVCMVLFFTSVGFQANLKVIQSGGKSLIIMLILVVILIVGQNFIAVGMANVLGVHSLVGLATGSIPMVGGHGTAGAFGPVLEDFGVTGATTICTAAATFGLITGSLLGGPMANGLIRKFHLISNQKNAVEKNNTEEVRIQASSFAKGLYQLIIVAGLGTIVSTLLAKTGMTFPVYIGAMIVAAIYRNFAEITGKLHVEMESIDVIGSLSLSLFLGIAMISLKIWQLADLALPLIVLLLSQTIFMYVFSRYIVFNFMGRDYDAAVMSAGTCGFGMGATPNAMANMQVITNKYGPSIKAFIVIPIIGSLFADFINSLVITFFINLL